jgi:aldose 1-epimerase
MVNQSISARELTISRTSNNCLSMAVISAFGGSLSFLSLFDRIVIDRTNAESIGQYAYGTVLAPWPNRIPGGTYEFLGNGYKTEVLDAAGNANHGLLRKREMEVRQHEDSFIVLGYLFGEDDVYPFSVDLEVRYELTDQGLETTATAKNLSGDTVPFAIGFHPYFATEEPFVLHTNGSELITTDERLIPNGRKKLDANFGLDFHTEQAFDGCVVANWAKLEFEGYNLLIEASENLPYLMVYRPPMTVLESGGQSLAVEPMSHPTNVFQTDIDSAIMNAHETKSYFFSVRTN